MHEDKVWSIVTMKTLNDTQLPAWFAIKTRQDFKASEILKSLCDDVLFPQEEVRAPGGKTRKKAVIPHVLFLKTTHDNILNLEQAGREHPEMSVPFWIYRYPNERAIQVIPQQSIDLLRLLTADDATRCEIFTKKDFQAGQRVRVIGGIYEGYEGYIQRVRKNKHVIVRIEGICMIMLPFIHPDLLSPLD